MRNAKDTLNFVEGIKEHAKEMLKYCPNDESLNTKVAVAEGLISYITDDFEIKEFFKDNIAPKGDLMTLKEFRSCVRSGCFTDYDGIGFYANKEGTTHNEVELATVSRKVPEHITHVLWYNK